MRTATLLLTLCTLTACGTTGSNKPLTASVAQFHLEPLPAMVARKVDLPLYLVVGAADVPEVMHVTGTTIVIFTIPDVDVTNVRTFATRDLKQALETYFSSVVVVYDEKQLPKTPHVRAQIKVTKLEYDRRIVAGPSGQQTQFWGALEWAFGLHVSDQPDFVFSFAERSGSATGMKGFGDTSEWESTFQEALRHMLAEYVKQGVQQKLLATAP